MPGVVAFSLSFFCIKLSVTGIYYWFPTYLQDQLNFSKPLALDMFSLFGTGSFLGNSVLGLASDIAPMRTPFFEIGVIGSTVFIFCLTSLESESSIKAVCFFMGAFVFASQNVIAALECDIGNYVKTRYNYSALGTFSGMIDGFANIGGVISQALIALVKDKYGWKTTFNILAVIYGLSALPALQFMIFEYR
jgi:sugar phosphate permease